MTQDAVASELTDAGVQTGKAAVSAWEKNRNVPDSLMLGRLAQLYDTTSDALLGLSSLSAESQRFAAQLDALPSRDRKRALAMWAGYFEGAADEPAPAPARERRSAGGKAAAR